MSGCHSPGSPEKRQGGPGPSRDSCPHPLAKNLNARVQRELEYEALLSPEFLGYAHPSLPGMRGLQITTWSAQGDSPNPLRTILGQRWMVFKVWSVQAPSVVCGTHFCLQACLCGDMRLLRASRRLPHLSIAVPQIVRGRVTLGMRPLRREQSGFGDSQWFQNPAEQRFLATQAQTKLGV